MEAWPGTPYPLGASYAGTGTNFSIFSEVATRVELCLFDDHGNEVKQDLPERTALCCHGYVPNIYPGQSDGFRVHGPYEPRKGARCNPAKLLLDPYAKAIGRDIKGKASLAIYLVAVPLAFASALAAFVLYVAVAVVWLVPDRRVEKVLLTEEQ